MDALNDSERMQFFIIKWSLICSTFEDEKARLERIHVKEDNGPLNCVPRVAEHSGRQLFQKVLVKLHKQEFLRLSSHIKK